MVLYINVDGFYLLNSCIFDLNRVVGVLRIYGLYYKEQWFLIKSFVSTTYFLYFYKQRFVSQMGVYLFGR